MATMISTALIASIVLAPVYVLLGIRLLLFLLGKYLVSTTKDRRQRIYSQYGAEYRKKKQESEVSTPWEKIEKLSSSKQEDKGPKSDVVDEWSGVVGFFHPFCNAGGGGERVLWAAIETTQRRHPKSICAVYTGDHEVERDTLIRTVKQRFDISLKPETLHFIYLSRRHYVLATTYPHFTLLGQSLGSLVLAYEAFSLLVPDVFVDTMGYSFALALSRYLFPSVPTGAYVHYPTISTDMLDSLDDTTGAKGIHSGAGSGWRGSAKKIYWRGFAWLYGWTGRQVDVVMCNSTWTMGHISQLWQPKKSGRHGHGHGHTAIVYPPCPVRAIEAQTEVSPTSEKKRENIVLYTAQFRPEKNHSLILRAFAKFYHAHMKSTSTPTSSSARDKSPRLVLIGSVRANTPDERHIYNLRLEARELKITEATTFICDAPFSTILTYLQRASIGVNGMYAEHFGIGNVEGLAAGLLLVVNNSGGPKLDIVVPYEGKEIGYHAETDEEYAAAFTKILELSDEERLAMRTRARKSAGRFTDEAFAEKWSSNLDVLIRMTKGKK